MSCTWHLRTSTWWPGRGRLSGCLPNNRCNAEGWSSKLVQARVSSVSDRRDSAIGDDRNITITITHIVVPLSMILSVVWSYSSCSISILSIWQSSRRSLKTFEIIHPNSIFKFWKQRSPTLLRIITMSECSHDEYSLGGRLTLCLALHQERLVLVIRLRGHLEEQLIGGRLLDDLRR